MANLAKKNDKRPDKAQGDRPVNPLGKINYILMAVCLLLIIVGFVLMSGDANEGDTFNYDIFSNTRTVVGPTFAFAGFVLMAFAIIFRPGQKQNKEADK